MAEPVHARRLTDQEGQRLQQIVRRGSTNSVRYRRAMMILASASGNRVPVIAQLVAADEDTAREVIHRFNEIGLACLDPHWAGGRPRLLTADQEDLVVATATTRPTTLGQPFTRWSVRKLAGYLAARADRPIRIGREALRTLQVIAEHGDDLRYGGRKGAASAAYVGFIRGLAACAFQPGGFAGSHWCVGSGHNGTRDDTPCDAAIAREIAEKSAG
jgi:transposase